MSKNSRRLTWCKSQAWHPHSSTGCSTPPGHIPDTLAILLLLGILVLDVEADGAQEHKCTTYKSCSVKEWILLDEGRHARFPIAKQRIINFIRLLESFCCFSVGRFLVLGVEFRQRFRNLLCFRLLDHILPHHHLPISLDFHTQRCCGVCCTGTDSGKEEEE